MDSEELHSKMTQKGELQTKAMERYNKAKSLIDRRLGRMGDRLEKNLDQREDHSQQHNEIVDQLKKARARLELLKSGRTSSESDPGLKTAPKTVRAPPADVQSESDSESEGEE